MDKHREIFHFSKKPGMKTYNFVSQPGFLNNKGRLLQHDSLTGKFRPVDF